MIIKNTIGISQRKLEDRLQFAVLDIDENAVQRIKSEKRFITDVEIVVIIKVLNITSDLLIG